MSLTSRWAIGVWLAFIFSCVIIISRTQFSADLSAFLPRSPTPAQQLLVEQLRDGVVSRLLLIGLEGATPEVLAQTSKQLAAKLRKHADFVSINNGENTGQERDRDFLWRNRYLLSPAITLDHFSAAALRSALEEDLQLLSSPAGALVKQILPADPSGELIRLLEQLGGQTSPAMRDGVWFAKDGKRALLVVQTRRAGYDTDAQASAIATINSAFSEVKGGLSGASVRLLVSGPGVFAVNTRARIQGDAWRFSVIAMVLIATLLLVVYRSVRVLILGLLPVVSGALAGVAAVSLGFGSVHGITLGFGATLIGEGVDYAIYLFTQITPSTTPQTTFKRIWPTLRLGVLTSICGFSAMLFSGFPGLAQLGLFSIAGLIIAVTVTRWVLPALLPPGFSARAITSVAPALTRLVRGAPRLRYPLLLVTLVATLYLGFQRAPLWSNELSGLSPTSQRDQLLDEQLRRDIGAPDIGHLIIINAQDEESALQASESVTAMLQRLSQNGVLQGYESPTSYLPSRAMQRARQAALPSSETLRENLQKASHDLPFRPGLFEPFLRSVDLAKTQEQVDRTDLRDTNLILKVDSLLVKRDSGWAAMLPLRGVHDPAVIARELAYIPVSHAVLLDLKKESNQLYQTYRRDALHYSLLGALAIVVLLFASLRSPRRVVEVIAPLVAAVLIVTAVLVLTGHQLSIFHLVGLLLVVAVGSNYSLFFDRQSASNEDRERMMVSLLFANVSTMIGFGLLSFSEVPLLRAIGSTVGLGAILSLIFSAILIVRPAPSLRSAA